MRMLELARDYQSRGMQPLPLNLRSKNPGDSIGTGWQNFRTTADDLSKHFNGRDANIGVLLGKPSGGLVDIDLDTAFARKVAPFYLPKTPAVFGRAGSPRSHYLFRCEKEHYQKFNNPVLLSSEDKADRERACIVEFRGKCGLQTVMPGSQHEGTGELIEWAEDGEPTNIAIGKLMPAVSKIAAAALVCEAWKYGVRQDLAMALAGGLLRRWPIAEVETFIRAVCHATGDEEAEDRIKAVRSTATKLKANQNVVGFPKLAELTDPKVVAAVCKWLEIDLGEQKTSSADEPGELKVVRMSEVQKKEIPWLWKPFVPKGFFTIVDGVEGIGKTYLMLKIAAVTAAGGSFPGSDSRVAAGNVLLISAEDSAAYILKPRLEAIGAPCERIFALDQPLTLDDKGFIMLEAFIIKYEIKFVLIDPLFSFTGRLNINDDSEVKPFTNRLNTIAERNECVIAGVRHLTKTKGYGDARNSGMGSVGWRAGARSALIVGHDPENKAKRAITQTKINIGPESEISFGYEITADGVFRWTGESDLSADTMLSFKQAESIEERGAKGEAIRFLRTFLQRGRRGSAEVQSEARSAGIAEKTLQRAKQAIGVESTKDSSFSGGWFWELPAEDGHINEVGHVRGKSESKSSVSNHLLEVSQSDHLRASKAEGGQDGQLSTSDQLGAIRGRAYGSCSSCSKAIYTDRPCPFCSEGEAA